MKKEDYTYFVDNPYGSDVYSQKLYVQNSEWFKMLIVSFIIEKNFKNKFWFELEPFVKAPWAGIGEGEVVLVSA